jgi:hypothetical protein
MRMNEICHGIGEMRCAWAQTRQLEFSVDAVTGAWAEAMNSSSAAL